MPDLTIPPIFGAHAVLQRDRPLPIWGWSMPGAQVVVTLSAATQSATAGPDGAFTVVLPAQPAGGPYELIVASGSEIVRRPDVLIGEVWFAAGQSNMEFALQRCEGPAEELGDIPGIRCFQAERFAVPGGPRDVAGVWSVGEAGNVGAWSAIGYLVARELHRRLRVPVGIVAIAWGGSRIEAWLPRAALRRDPQASGELARYEASLARADAPARIADLVRRQRDAVAWERERAFPDPGNGGEAAGWAIAVASEPPWARMAIPGSWVRRGLSRSGVVWFRREVDIPASWAGRDLRLHLGAVDKHDTTYFDGERVGATGWERPDAWSTDREYPIPGRLVRPGRRIIAVRAVSWWYDGGLVGPADGMLLRCGGESMPLAGEWLWRMEHDYGPVRRLDLGPDAIDHNAPAILHESMLAPLAPFAARGMLWYQGESNAGDATGYRDRFLAFIRDLRHRWGEEFFVAWVQLAGFLPDGREPARSTWAELREAQALASAEPRTAMVTAIDCGDGADIHPRRKRPVALRLAWAVLHHCHGAVDLPAGGPRVGGVARDGDALLVRFSRVGGGLRVSTDSAADTSAGPVRGFDLAGVDGVFHAADAIIAGRDSVRVGCRAVAAPTAIRFAWGDCPIVGLTGGDSLPAEPFRRSLAPDQP
jgi:sialate O-acetylesterase